MELLVLYTGFILAAYAVIGNDVIQTLGTFLTSNNKTHWTMLGAFVVMESKVVEKIMRSFTRSGERH